MSHKTPWKFTSIYFYYFAGTLVAQLVADDPDGDNVIYSMAASVNDFPDIAVVLQLEENGR